MLSSDRLEVCRCRLFTFFGSVELLAASECNNVEVVEFLMNREQKNRTNDITPTEKIEGLQAGYLIRKKILKISKTRRQ